MSEPYWEPLAAAPPVAVAYGTSLPASPVDGQEAILVDSLTNPTYQWRFRYNAASSRAEKWEYIGGSAAHLESGPGGAMTATSVWVAWPGLSIVMPRAGLYRCTAVFWGQMGGGSSGTVEIGVGVGGITPTTVGGGMAPLASVHWTLPHFARDMSVVGPGNAISLYYWLNAPSNYGIGALDVQPVRVA